mmetsp:Transcript_2674/g.8053  ORF Transcript_2674/g.8053 Transcript_2674/m.8053 type:complete len:353 (-) Transcript_2674:431-1489(-)
MPPVRGPRGRRPATKTWTSPAKQQASSGSPPPSNGAQSTTTSTTTTGTTPRRPPPPPTTTTTPKRLDPAAQARSSAMQVSLTERGDAQLAKREFESARDLYGASLRLGFSADIAAKKAQCELELGNFEAAVECCDLALEREPKNPDALTAKAKALKEIIRARNGWTTRKASGNELFQRGDFAKALEAYDAALDVCDPKNRPVLYTNRAACYLRLGRAERSVEACDKSLELDPTWPRAFERKAQALRVMGKLDEALAVLEEGIAKNPETHDDLAKAKRELEDVINPPPATSSAAVLEEPAPPVQPVQQPVQQQAPPQQQRQQQQHSQQQRSLSLQQQQQQQRPPPPDAFPRGA